ncbi:putative long-chain-fatty-acid- ligase [Rosellinia necatrix]|uniref:Putative long-chain-fatty-acid-ligase n=1 Tax=Rosellinia necatrix TaxID=77044 RepID=A0A1S8A9F9_ROSNE|nr:putative long-chain-fatty-acid- ligase [Rosellinia necatrix]
MASKTSSQAPSALANQGQSDLSIVHGRRDIPLLNLDLGSLIRNQSKALGTRPAVITPSSGGSKRWSYAELEKHSKTLARALLAMGVTKGDRVAIFAGNTLEYCALVFAAGRIGAILATLNITYTPYELHRALKHIECKVLFLAPSICRGEGQYIDLVCDAPDLPTLEAVVLLDGEEHGTKPRCIQYPQLRKLSFKISDKMLEDVERAVDQHDICNLQFTSGTTGNPKAVQLTHHNIINNGRINGRQMGLGTADVLCCPPPLHHAFGLVLGLLAALTRGAAVAFPSALFDARAAVRCVRDERCTALHGVPAMWVAYLQHVAPGQDLAGVRTGISGGSPVPRPLMEAIQTRLKVKNLTIAFGMTETSPTAFMTSRFDPIDRQLGTVGQVLPHTSAKIVDAQGRIVPVGRRGEVCFSGYLLQKGYWRDPKQTAAVMKRDDAGVLWMHSGDEGFLDKDGYCTVTGRIKDIIIRGMCFQQNPYRASSNPP